MLGRRNITYTVKPLVPCWSHYSEGKFIHCCDSMMVSQWASPSHPHPPPQATNFIVDLRVCFRREDGWVFLVLQNSIWHWWKHGRLNCVSRQALLRTQCSGIFQTIRFSPVNSEIFLCCLCENLVEFIERKLVKCVPLLLWPSPQVFRLIHLAALGTPAISHLRWFFYRVTVLWRPLLWKLGVLCTQPSITPIWERQFVLTDLRVPRFSFCSVLCAFRIK